MNHWIAAPFLLPALTACVLVFVRGVLAQRAISLLSALTLAAIAGGLCLGHGNALPQVYAMGNWPSHLGIVFVLDGLAALMLVLTGVVAVAALLYASRGWDTRSRHFHALFHVQLMGLNGAFLTGDLFNLFVCFELMLIASYALLSHGDGSARLRAGLHYVTVNLVGSAVFLIAVSLLYRVGGTLNMADLGAALANASEADRPWIRAGGLMLLCVFLLKGAAFPLHLWQPAAYGSASAPAAMIFSVLTKVGAYAVFRVGSVVFGATAAAPHIDAVVQPLALLTLVVAALGAFSATTLSRLVAWLALASSASVLVGVGAFSAAGAGAAFFYALPSTLALAALFLIADAIADARGAPWGDRLQRAPRMHGATVLGLWYFAAAIAVSGLPPFAAFLGKALLMQGIGPSPWGWSIILATSLLNVVALARAGSRLFWSIADVPCPGEPAAARFERLGGLTLLGAGVVALTVAAGPVQEFTREAARQVAMPAGYVTSVLGNRLKGWTIRIEVPDGEADR